MSNERWNWKHWQQLARERVTDADALYLVETWPGYAKSKRSRSFWAHELLYDGAPCEKWDSMTRIMRAANVLEAVGLSSRCPGMPLYAPTMPAASEQESEQPA